MPILPPQFGSHSAWELLLEAEAGRIGFDQRLLRSLVARPEETPAALARFSSEIRPDRLLDLDEQVLDLFRHFNTPLAIPFYLRQAQRGEDGLSEEVVEALASLGAPAVEPLIEAIGKAEEDDRCDLVFLLAALGVRDERIESLIEKTLETDVYEGALCAGLYGDPALVPALERAMASLPEGDAARHERSALATTLAEIGGDARKVGPPPFDLFKLYPETASPHFEALPEDQVEEYLVCEFAEYRRDAALSLADEEYNEDTRDALLNRAREDSDPPVRAAAFRALGSVCATDAEVREFLLDALNLDSLTFAERASAAVALANGPGSGALHDAIHALYEVPETRAEAVEAMWRTRDLRYRRYIGENLRHAEAAVRASAATAVGAFPIPELAIELVPLFDDEDTRGQALFSYALAVAGKTSAKSVEKLIEKIDELAGGLSKVEYDTVASALDARLEREGLPPHFFPEEDEHAEAEGGVHVHGPDCGHEHPPEPAPVQSYRAGRNDPCPCGSGKKFKKCHGAPQ